MEGMIVGRMYCLDSVIETESKQGTRYILLGKGNCENSISFGRSRKLAVPSECYMVVFSRDEYEMEKVQFDSSGECDYLKVLKERKVAYKIPSVLPVSINRMYNRFECAIGATYWSKNIKGFFGKKGYAITSLGYIGDDRYESFDIHIAPETLYIGENSITRITGFNIPNDQFIEKMLIEENHIEEGEPFLEMIREAGMMGGLEHIRFETKE